MRSHLAWATLALMAIAPAATSQVSASFGSTRSDILYVMVWEPSQELCPNASLTCVFADGLQEKPTQVQPGVFVVPVLDSKVTLEAQHPTFGPTLFELNVPDLPVVVVDIHYSGPGMANLTMHPPADPLPKPSGGVPPNDLCENAIGPLPVPSSTFGSTTGATIDSSFPFCVTSITAPGVWYTVIGTGTTITATTCSNPFIYDTKISVYCGSCGEPICITGNDDNCAINFLQTTVTWCAQAGAEYLILVHGFAAGFGDFTLDLSENGQPCTPTVSCIPAGACCLPDGTCANGVTERDCAAMGGQYQGDGSSCTGGQSYTVSDCDQDFEDISATGNAGPVGDDAGITVPIGFTFNFFGDDHTTIGFSTNGYLSFGPTLADFTNDPCPTAFEPNDALFAYWDDFIVDVAGQTVYQTLGTAPNRRFIAQWTNVREFGTVSDTATFQAVLFENGSTIHYRYLDFNGVPTGAGDVTIGVENQGGSVAFCVPDTAVMEGDCIEFAPEGGIDCCVTLDFTTDDGGNPLVNGQDISTPPEFGNLVSLSSGGNNLGAAIFDTTPGGPNAGGPDPDLLVGLGNCLIVQDTLNPGQSIPGIFNVPNDAGEGGSHFLDFAGTVEGQSADLIDIDLGPPRQDAAVILIDTAGLMRVYDVPAGWTTDISVGGPPGFGTLDLTTLDPQPGVTSIATATEDAGFDATLVVRIEFHFSSSAGLDNVSFCPTGNMD